MECKNGKSIIDEDKEDYEPQSEQEESTDCEQIDFGCRGDPIILNLNNGFNPLTDESSFAFWGAGQDGMNDGISVLDQMEAQDARKDEDKALNDPSVTHGGHSPHKIEKLEILDGHMEAV